MLLNILVRCRLTGVLGRWLRSSSATNTSVKTNVQIPESMKRLEHIGNPLAILVIRRQRQGILGACLSVRQAFFCVQGGSTERLLSKWIQQTIIKENPKFSLVLPHSFPHMCMHTYKSTQTYTYEHLHTYVTSVYIDWKKKIKMLSSQQKELGVVSDYLLYTGRNFELKNM